MRCERERQVLRFELQRVFKSGDAVLVLIDPTVDRPEWMAMARPGLCHALPVPGYETSPHRRPTLVELRDGDDPVFAASLETALAQADDPDEPLRQVGGWLVTRKAPAELAGALGRWMTVRVGMGAARFARLNDPRVLWLMSALLHPQPLGLPSGVLSRWCVMDWHGALWDVPDHQRASSPGPARRPDGFMRSLGRAELLNQALRALLRQGIPIDVALARNLETRLARRESLVPQEAGPQRLHALLTDWSNDSPVAATRPLRSA